MTGRENAICQNIEITIISAPFFFFETPTQTQTLCMRERLGRGALRLDAYIVYDISAIFNPKCNVSSKDNSKRSVASLHLRLPPLFARLVCSFPFGAGGESSPTGCRQRAHH